jgi:polyhydroxybutyrate depolymerase
MLVGCALLVAGIVNAAPGTDHTITLQSSGKSRTAIVHLPPIPATPFKLALVANLHTLAENAKKEEKLTGMDDLADTEGFVVVYPNGLLAGNSEPWLPGGVGKSWNGGTCCPKACAEKVQDVQFMRDLVPFVAQFVQNVTNGGLEIDRTRVYACGASNGAFMVNRVGCEAPDLFAAIAPLSGPIGNGTSEVWKADPYDCPVPNRPLPTLYFHGTKDPLVPWNGKPSMGFPSVASYIALRKTLNGIPSSDNGTISFLNHTVNCTSYGESESNVTFCAHEAGHCWPGSTAQGVCTMDIHATPHIWEFFKRYQLPEDPERPELTEYPPYHIS